MKVKIKKELVLEIKNMVGDDEHFKNKLEILANILIKDEIQRHKSHS